VLALQDVFVCTEELPVHNLYGLKEAAEKYVQSPFFYQSKIAVLALQDVFVCTEALPLHNLYGLKEAAEKNVQEPFF
jgi:hypothetical protein